VYPSDLLKVEGGAEPYYLMKHLEKNYDISCYSRETRDGKSQKNVEMIKLPNNRLSSFFPESLMFDLIVLAKIISSHIDLKKEVYIWTYKDVYLCSTLGALMPKWKTIVDLRTPPIQQSEVFSSNDNYNSFLRNVKNLMKTHAHKLILKMSDKVICVSQELEKYVCEKYNISAHKTYVQTLGVDLQKFKNINMNNEELVNMVYLTSINRLRGFGLAFDVVKHLRKYGLETRLTVIGSGEENVVKSLQRVADKKNVSKCISWRGYLPHEAIPEELAKYNVGISPLPPILPFKLSSPTKVFEYLAAGLLVAATNIAAHEQIIRDGENGVLLPYNDARKWADEIYNIHTENDKMLEMRKTARESADLYDWTYMLNRLESVVLE